MGLPIAKKCIPRTTHSVPTLNLLTLGSLLIQYFKCQQWAMESKPISQINPAKQQRNIKTVVGKVFTQVLSDVKWHPMHPWLQVSIWPVKGHLGWFGSVGFMFSTHILESLEAAPPVTLATRSWDNSFFRSSSCFSSSSFFLPRRSLALILAWMTENKQTGCKESMGIKHAISSANTHNARLTLSSVRYTFALLRGNIQAICYQY